MANDVLSLGPFVFDGHAAPEELPAGGRHQLIVHRMAGGDRVIDAMGPDDIDRIFEGTFWQDGAVAQALAIDALRRAGTPLPYSNGVEARTVVIMEFLFQVKSPTHVDYSIILTPTDSFGGGGAFGFSLGFAGFGLSASIGLGSIEAVVSADIGFSTDLLAGASSGVSASLGLSGIGLNIG